MIDFKCALLITKFICIYQILCKPQRFITRCSLENHSMKLSLATEEAPTSI